MAKAIGNHGKVETNEYLDGNYSCVPQIKRGWENLIRHIQGMYINPMSNEKTRTRL